MQAAVITKTGSLDQLKLVERAEPKPGAGEVLVRLRAASLNYRDLVVVAGGYGSQQRHDDLVPLSDGAGEIVALGSEVDVWKVGDRVVGCFFPRWQAGPIDERRHATALGGSVDGVACELRVFAADAILPLPPHLSYVEAATLPCAGLTAWTSVTEHGQIGPGMSVLTQGTGGVSLFALQFARMAGADVVATSSNADKLDKLRSIGAGHAINYRDDPNWGRTALAIHPEGMHLVVDIGGGETLAQSLRAVRMGGTISIVGVVGGAKFDLNVPVVIMKNVVLRGASVGNRDQFARMLAAMSHHRMRPVVDRVFPLHDLRAALEHLKSGRHIGKICIEI